MNRSFRAKIAWTAEMDGVLRHGVSAEPRRSFVEMAKELGLSPSTVMSRALALGVHKITLKMRRPSAYGNGVTKGGYVPVEHGPEDRDLRVPMRAGHPISWNAITASTSVAGMPWPG